MVAVAAGHLCVDNFSNFSKSSKASNAWNSWEKVGNWAQFRNSNIARTLASLFEFARQLNAQTWPDWRSIGARSARDSAGVAGHLLQWARARRDRRSQIARLCREPTTHTDGQTDTQTDRQTLRQTGSGKSQHSAHTDDKPNRSSKCVGSEPSGLQRRSLCNVVRCSCCRPQTAAKCVMRSLDLSIRAFEHPSELTFALDEANSTAKLVACIRLNCSTPAASGRLDSTWIGLDWIDLDRFRASFNGRRRGESVCLRRSFLRAANQRWLAQMSNVFAARLSVCLRVCHLCRNLFKRNSAINFSASRPSFDEL